MHMRSITRHIAVRNDLTKVQEMEDLDNTIQELLKRTMADADVAYAGAPSSHQMCRACCCSGSGRAKKDDDAVRTADLDEFQGSEGGEA